MTSDQSIHRDSMPTMVCICGSTRQREEMVELNRRLTMEGKIVLAPGVFQHDGDPLTEEEKARLDALHFRKIDMADEVHFIRKPDGSFGSSTSREHDHATSKAKRIVHHDADAELADGDPNEELAKALYDGEQGDGVDHVWEHAPDSVKSVYRDRADAGLRGLAARALREAARDWNGGGPGSEADERDRRWLMMRATRIEREAGESDERHH